jgi:hypothetical protein
MKEFPPCHSQKLMEVAWCFSSLSISVHRISGHGKTLHMFWGCAQKLTSRWVESIFFMHQGRVQVADVSLGNIMRMIRVNWNQFVLDVYQLFCLCVICHTAKRRLTHQPLNENGRRIQSVRISFEHGKLSLP